MSESRLATLRGVYEMLEKMREDWSHIDSGEQALRAARDEIGTWIEATRNAMLDGAYPQGRKDRR